MNSLIERLNTWMEVWALFLPLLVMMWNKHTVSTFLPVKLYVIVALLLNLWADLSWQYQRPWHLQGWQTINTWVYSLHSVARFFLMWWFFTHLRLPIPLVFKRILPVLYAAAVLLILKSEGFIFYEMNSEGKLMPQISYRLLSAEACLMLVYCFAYYFQKIQDDSFDIKRDAAFWAITGLCVFSVCSFPIYLFYPALNRQDIQYTVHIWLIPKIAFLVFCLFLSKAFQPNISLRDPAPINS